MKIAAYNIRSGGFTRYEEKGDQPARISLLQKAVKEIDADLIGLIDTYRWPEIFTKKDIQQLFGYEHIAHVPLDSANKGPCSQTTLTTLSRIPFTHTQKRIYNRNVMKVTVAIEKQLMDIFVTYFDYSKESNRRKEAHSLLKLVTTDLPTIVMGDMNTFGRFDIPKELSAGLHLISHILHLDTILPPSWLTIINSRVPEYFREAGFTSVNAGHTPTGPTPLFMGRLAPACLELDYIWSRGIGVTHGRILREGIFDKASDHFPIVGTLTI